MVIDWFIISWSGTGASYLTPFTKFPIYQKHRHSGFPAIGVRKKWLKTGMFCLCDETEICNTNHTKNS